MKLKEMYAMQNLISCGFAPTDKDDLEDTEYSRGNLYISSSDRILMKTGKRVCRKHRYLSLMYEAPAYDRDIADLVDSGLFEQ